MSVKNRFFTIFQVLMPYAQFTFMLISPDLPVILAIWCEIRIQHEKCDFPRHSEYLKRSIISKDKLFRVLHIILHFLTLTFIGNFIILRQKKWGWPKNFFDGEFYCESYRGIPVFQFDRFRPEKAEKLKVRFRGPRLYYAILRHS